MFKALILLVMSMLMSFSVMAACPEKCNNSCGSGECATAACGCDDNVTTSESPDLKDCKYSTDAGRQSDADGDGGSNAADPNVQEN